jgi:hypothetical protein
MPGRRSRDKGARGEREVVHVFLSRGVRADRTAPLQAGCEGDADIRTALEGLFLEVKRQENLRIPDWTRKLEEDCPEGREPVLIFRQNGRPHHPEKWRAQVSLDFLIDLLTR